MGVCGHLCPNATQASRVELLVDAHGEPHVELDDVRLLVVTGGQFLRANLETNGFYAPLNPFRSETSSKKKRFDLLPTEMNVTSML